MCIFHLNHCDVSDYQNQLDRAGHDTFFDEKKEVVIAIDHETRKESFRAEKQYPSQLWLCRLNENVLPINFTRNFGEMEVERRV